MFRKAPSVALPLALAAFSGIANSQTTESSNALSSEFLFDRPDRDRWSYPFNFTPGFRSAATIFGAADVGPGFDDRDAQFIVGFDTDPTIPMGLDPSYYLIRAVRVEAYVSAGDQFVYDPSYDSYKSHLLATDPNFVADADPGRPVELFGTAYRNGFDLATWTEASVFGGTPDVEPAQGARNIFAAEFDLAGVPADVSNHVKGGDEIEPAAIGTLVGTAPGALVPFDAEMTFELDLCNPGLAVFLRESLAAGKLNLAITGLHFAIGGPDGGAEDPQYPAFYTRDDALADLLGLTASLTIDVAISNPVDFNGDGIIDNGDIARFLELFLAGDPNADLTFDCLLDNGDIAKFVELFLGSVG